MKTLFLIFLTCSISLAQSYPGSFTRLGLNAKGMALGNSIAAMTEGNVYTYYNPALASFQNDGSVSASVSLLALDRELNALTYTQSLKPTAGLSLGILNATVSNIDGRDADGVHTSDLSTSENLFFFSFSNKFSEGFSLGLNLKLYYYKLYGGITSTSIGFDLGAAYRVTGDLSMGVVVADLGENYHWDSSSLYGTDGSNFITAFPHVVKLAASYALPITPSVLSVEYDVAPAPLNGLRVGLEVSPFEVLAIRAGVSSSNEQHVGTQLTWSFGFGAKVSFLDLAPEINYAYVVEPFVPNGIQSFSLIFGF